LSARNFAHDQHEKSRHSEAGEQSANRIAAIAV